MRHPPRRAHSPLQTWAVAHLTAMLAVSPGPRCASLARRASDIGAFPRPDRVWVAPTVPSAAADTWVDAEKGQAQMSTPIYRPPGAPREDGAAIENWRVASLGSRKCGFDQSRRATIRVLPVNMRYRCVVACYVLLSVL